MRDRPITLTAVALVISITTGWGQEASAHPDVAIYVENDTPVPGLAKSRVQDTVVAVFASIGVRLGWVGRRPTPFTASTNSVVLHVRFEWRAAHTRGFDTLGYSFPFGDGRERIVLLCYRIRESGGGWMKGEQIMAHVMAHEIGHVLAGTDGHSATGVMKAHWNVRDFNAMQQKPLEFTSGYAELVRRGLAILKARRGIVAGSDSR